MGNFITSFKNKINKKKIDNLTNFDNLDDYDKKQLIDFIKNINPKSLKLEKDDENKIKQFVFETNEIIPFCIEYYSKLNKICNENVFKERKNTKKNFFIKPTFDKDKVYELIIKSSAQISPEFDFYDIKEPEKKLNADNLTLEEFRSAFNIINNNKDMIGISKKMISLLSPYHSTILINNFNKIFNDNKSTKNISFGKGDYQYKVNKRGPKDNINSFRLIISIPNIINHFHRILSLRLKNYMFINNYLDTNIQKGGISGQKFAIFQQIYKIKRIIKHANQNNNKLAILFLDIKDAFGSINLTILCKILDQYYVDKKYSNYIKSFYNNFEYYVKTNSWTTESLNWDSGLIQGCSLSPILFVIALNYILTKLDSEKDNHGYQVNLIKVLLLAFVDDICIVCKDKQSLNIIYQKIKVLLKMLGLNINNDKTAIMLVNEENDFTGTSLENIKVVNHYKYLGEYIRKDNNYTKSYLTVLRMVKKILENIDSSNLSNEEKIQNFNENYLNIIQRKILNLYDMDNNQKIKIFNITKPYLDKWKFEGELNIFADVKAILKETNDEVINNLEDDLNEEYSNKYGNSIKIFNLDNDKCFEYDNKHILDNINNIELDIEKEVETF